MAEIQQYFYTRLPKDQSPRNKYGFQSVFVPEKFQDRSFILELESRIHFPEYDTFEEKSVVFYRDIDGAKHLVIFWMRLLPDARDEQGRGGIFMVQGYIVPPEIHQMVQRPLTLLYGVLEKYLFIDREDALNSPLADREAGLIKPLVLSADDMALLSQEEPGGELQLWEKQLLSFMIKQTRGEMEDWVLALKGDPKPVESVLNKLAGFMPSEVREQVGWDPAFDGGKIFFSPFKTFGYSKAEPVTGRPMIFDLATLSFLDSSLFHRLLSMDDPFDRYINSRLTTETTQEQIDATYKMATSLMQGIGVPEGMVLEGDFAELIDELARNYLETAVVPLTKGAWASRLKNALSLQEVCELLNLKLEASKLAAGLEKTIIAQGIVPVMVEWELPKGIVAKGTPRLQMLNCMWTEQEPQATSLRKIPQPGLLEAFRLFAATPLVKKKWFFPLLAQFPGVFHRMVEDTSFREITVKWLNKQVPRSHRPMKEELVNFMLNQNRLDHLAKEDRDWNVLLEDFIRETRYSDKELKKALAIAEKTGLSPQKSPLLDAYAFPKEDMPAYISRNDELRSRFSHALIIAHDYSRKELRKLGFSDSEITRAIRWRKGIVNKIRTLLGH